jgi:hypothetical protein
MPAYESPHWRGEIVVKAKVVEAKTDVGAVALAETMLDGQDLKIWTGTGQVGNGVTPPVT